MSTTLLVPQAIRDRLASGRLKCDSCQRFTADNDGTMVCTKHPPQSTFLIVPCDPPRIGMQAKAYASYPPISATTPACGEHEPSAV